MSDNLRRNQHLVSKGYQRNFAEGQWIAVVDARTGKLVSPRRSISVNWRVPDFLSVISPDGDVDDSLEREFARSERVFLNVIRGIELHHPLSPAQKSALDALAATHAVRSLRFAIAHEVAVSSIEQGSVGIAQDVRAVEAFTRDKGRPLNPGELEAVIAAAASDFAASPDLLASGIRRVAGGLQQLLGKWTIQLVGSSVDLPGFVLADHPVLHGRRSEGRFGFRDAGAIGDADLVVVPISRRLVAFYSARNLTDVRIRTKKGVRWVNSLLLRGAQSEVACHPDDAQETSRLIRDADRYPPTKFDSITIR
jgi:Protein of unknown function (DUF4238)